MQMTAAYEKMKKPTVKVGLQEVLSESSNRILQQEIFQLFTLFFDCFLNHCRSTTLASPGFVFAVLINVFVFSWTSSTFRFTSCFGSSHSLQQFVRINAVSNQHFTILLQFTSTFFDLNSGLRIFFTTFVNYNF